MKDLALRALDAVARRGVNLCRRPRHRDPRAGDHHQERQGGSRLQLRIRGIGIRVLASGCWGFAATDDLTREGVEAAAQLALEIARAGTAARKREVSLAPEEKYEATWVSPFSIDPFSVPVDEKPRRAAGRGPGTAPHPGRQPGGDLDALRAAAAGLRLDARKPDRPDPLSLGRRLFGALLPAMARSRSAPTPIRSAGSTS